MECPICLESIEEEEVQLINCNHIFHGACINTWLKIKPSCPLCRISTLSSFNGRQYFGKNKFLKCSISFKYDDVLEIKYNEIYNAQLNLKKIKNISTDKTTTIIKFNYNDKFIDLKFKIEQTFLFVEYFKNYVSKLSRNLNHT
jgi:hypothetical protein